MLAFTTSLVLFLLIQPQQHVLASAQMTVLKTLVQSNCLQRCYIAGCDDLEPRCVCQQLADGLVVARTCAIKTCNKENAFADLWAECLSRKDELGATALSSALPTLTTSADAGGTPAPDATSSTHTSNHETTKAPEANLTSTHISNHDLTNVPSPQETPVAITAKSTSPTIIALAVTLPILFLAALAGIIFLFIRQRQKRLQRLSISTFMDESDANNPVIGGPLEVKKEKLPPALNDLLQGLSTPPLVARVMSPRSDGDPFKDRYFVAAPMPGNGAGGGRVSGLSLFPAPAGGRPRPPPPPPLPIPQSPKPVLSASRGASAFRRGSTLSIISEASMGGSSPNTQVEMRIAYQELRREILRQERAERSDYSDWGAAVGQDGQGRGGDVQGRL